MNGPITIIGAGGFIGTNLRRAMLRNGCRVRAMSRSWLAPPEHELEQVFTGDVEDRHAVERAIEGSRCVVLLSHALLPGTPLEQAGPGMLRSLDATLHVAGECAKRGARLVYLSSGGTVYGPGVGIPTPESAPCNPISLYGASKLAAEKVLAVYARQAGLNCIVLRVSNPYGPWQLGRNSQGVIGAWLTSAIEGREIEIWGDGSVVRDYVYIDDVIGAILLATDYEGAESVFNIGFGAGATLQDVANIIRSLCPVPVRYREGRPVDVPVNILAIENARRELGWAPSVELKAGIEGSLRWLLARRGKASEAGESG